MSDNENELTKVSRQFVVNMAVFGVIDVVASFSRLRGEVKDVDVGNYGFATFMAEVEAK